MSEAFQAAVLIGRFQPFHNGHAALLRKALESAPRVIVVLGSAFQARGAKDPFTCEETGFALPDSELETALSGVAVFDHPDRSIRGRTITHAHYFELSSGFHRATGVDFCFA